MKVYVAGGIRGIPNYFEAFAKASGKLRQDGHTVYNPAAANLEGSPLNRIMSHVLGQLCECEAIALLPGWWRSGGTRIEWLLARYLGLQVIYLKREDEVNMYAWIAAAVLVVCIGYFFWGVTFRG